MLKRFFSFRRKVKSLNPAFKKSDFSPNDIGILGAPFKRGQPKDGVDEGPDAVRQYGLIEQLEKLGIDVKDYGNLTFKDNLDKEKKGKFCNPLTVGAANKKISDTVKKVLLDGRKCITIGGDHSIAMGTVHGHAQVKDVCLLWIDAHADINTQKTTISGNLHGCPVAFLVHEMKKYQDRPQGFEWLDSCVKKTHLAYIGLRDIDPMEKLILTKEKIVHFTMKEVDKLGINEVITQALDAINPMRKLSLHVSLDIDCIDKVQAPCTGTPVMGGLTVRETLQIAEAVSELDCFHALDVVEINPQLGTDDQVDNTIETAILLILTFLGHSRQGSLPCNVREIPSC